MTPLTLYTIRTSTEFSDASNSLYDGIELVAPKALNVNNALSNVCDFLVRNIDQITKNVSQPSSVFFYSEKDALASCVHTVHNPLCVVALEIDMDNSPEPIIQTRNQIEEICFKEPLAGKIQTIKPLASGDYRGTQRGRVLMNDPECIHSKNHPEYKNITLPRYTYFDAQLNRLVPDRAGLFYSIRAAIAVLNDLKNRPRSIFFSEKLASKINLLETAIYKYSLNDMLSENIGKIDEIEEALQIKRHPLSQKQTTSYTSYLEHYNNLSETYPSKQTALEMRTKSARH